MVARSAAANKSTGAPCAICCASAPVAPKLKITRTPVCRSNAAPISEKAGCKFAAAEIVNERGGTAHAQSKAKPMTRQHRIIGLNGNEIGRNVNRFFNHVVLMYNAADLIVEDVLMSDRPIRVLIAKPGLDGHDRGAKVVARALRDSGMEVIYTGIRQTPEMIAEAALQEDVDVVGLSILSGAHMDLFPRIVEMLKAKGIDDVVLVAGGIIPDEDMPAVKQMGFAGAFGPGTSTQDLAQFIREQVALKRGATAA